VQTAARGIFAELGSLRQLNKNTKEVMYPQYLALVHKIAKELNVPAENIEFFLYEFGSGVKDIEQTIRLRAYELYEQRGREHGLDLQDWFNAEAEIRGTR
jgi:hypothetical protein